MRRGDEALNAMDPGATAQLGLADDRSSRDTGAPAQRDARSPALATARARSGSADPPRRLGPGWWSSLAAATFAFRRWPDTLLVLVLMLAHGTCRVGSAGLSTMTSRAEARESGSARRV